VHRARDQEQQRVAGRALFRFLRSSEQVSDQLD
jgi:hypothetical protein